MLWIRTGSGPALARALEACLREALSEGSGEILLIVPDQATLQTEKDFLPIAGAAGSFRLQVLSPARLCERIFSTAGRPTQARIDQQGRVMVLQRAARRLKDRFRWYGTVCLRPGFAEKIDAQIRLFKQAHLTYFDLSDLARQQEDAPLGYKLADLSLLYEEYENALQGRYMDGEDEAERAVERLDRVPFLRDARVFVHGFDLINGSLLRMLLALAQRDIETTLFMPAAGPEARDRHLYRPAENCLRRTVDAARVLSIPYRRIPCPEEAAGPASALEALGQELYCLRKRPWRGDARDVTLCAARDPYEEAAFAAGFVRRVARREGLRYGEIAIACQTLSPDYAAAIEQAFRAADVPVFLAVGRRADRHPLSQFLLSGLRSAVNGFLQEDVALFLRSGFGPLEQDEADELINFLEVTGLRGRRMLAPIVPRDGGDEARALRLEELRNRAMTPLLTLRDALRRAGSARDALGAIYRMLQDAGAMETLQRQRLLLETEGLQEAAAEGAQVWNRILSALDQMAELMGDERCHPRQLCESLTQALAAAEVKPLPQAVDAVECGEAAHIRARRVRLLILMGMNEEDPPMVGGLLDEQEAGRLGGSFDAYLQLTEDETLRLRRLSLKNLIASATQRLLVTTVRSDLSGGALKPGPLVEEIQSVLGDSLAVAEGREAEMVRRVRLEAAPLALRVLPELVSMDDPLAPRAISALSRIPEARLPLERMRRADSFRVGSENLAPSLARALLGTLYRISPSRLETFGRCPFLHFVNFGLRPMPFEPFSLTPRTAGVFYHQALEVFLRENGGALKELSEDEGAARMAEIAKRLQTRDLSLAEEEPLLQNEYRRWQQVAQRSARVLVRHFAHSDFTPADLEAALGSGDVHTPVGQDARLEGRIDRLDHYRDPQGLLHQRIIDYKTGGRAASLLPIYEGCEMQLALYLQAALNQYGGRPAGMFYFPVQDPLPLVESSDPGDVETARNKVLRLSGYAIDDLPVIQAMASDPAAVMGIELNRDGSLRANSRVLSEKQFYALLRRVRRRADGMIRDMRDGVTRILPACIRDESPCQTCSARGLCQWEPRLPGARVRRIRSMRDSEILARLEDAQDDGGSSISEF